MDNKLSLHLRTFNDRIRLLNSGTHKQLVLTAQEARSLHADIQDLLSHCAYLSKQIANLQSQESVITVSVDGGGFK